jgi:Mn2+/Fe2+ NRAMP family transporter
MTLIEGFKRHISSGFAIAMLVILSSIILSALIGVLGIIAEVLYTWSEGFIEGGISITIWAAITATCLYVLVVIGNTKSFEKMLAILVAIMGISFISTMIINFPGIEIVISGFIPKMPQEALGSDNNPLVVVTGVVGTTVSVFVLVIRTGLIKEKGWKIQDLKLDKRDSAVSASLMFLISTAVMITAATTLYEKGIRLNHIAEMIPMLEPIFGSFAMSIFILGIIAAGLSSHLPNLLVIPWILDDYRALNRDTTTMTNRIILFILSVFSFVGVSFNIKPVYLMLLSQACISVVLPLVVVAIIYLTSKKSIMGEYRTTKKDYIVLAGILMFAMYMSFQGIKGLIIDLS